MTVLKCALCLDEASRDPTTPVFDAETQLGPVPCCGRHVKPAMVLLGYPGEAGTPVVDWLELVDAKELEAAAMDLVGGYDAEMPVGQAFLTVLTDAAKEQQA